MATTLEMVFRTETGKETTLSLADPREGLNLAEVQTVMQDIVVRDIFTTKNGDFAEAVEARIRTSDTVTLS